MPRDPADVSGAPVDIGLGVQIENVFVRVCRLGQVAARGVQDAFRFACRARGVKNEERVLRVERLRLVLVASVANCLAPFDVTTLDPGDILVGATHDQNIFHGCALASAQCLIDRWLQRTCLALAIAAVCGDHEFCIGIFDA